MVDIEPLPEPGVTPKLLWAQMNNAAIESRYLNSLEQIGSQIATQHTADQAVFASKTYEMSGVELAHSENVTGVVTTIPVFASAALAVPGCLITVPANADPVWVEWGGVFFVATAGSGLLQLSVWDVTAGGTGTEVFSGYLGVRDFQPLYSGYGNNFLGRKKLEPSVNERIFQLKTLLIRDASGSLTATLWNSVSLPTFISAVQR